jgi:DNA-entry nuclease
MPTEDRGSIGQVKPTGWQTVKYDIVDGKYLYNRCHLIGFQLTGENANRENLITGTRYLNIEGMLPFENQVAAYVKETGNHVMYRVTPVFVGTELVARGVVIEGYSVEDEGEEISFCVFAYNVQPGIRINYKNGESMLWGDGEFEEEESSSDSLPSSEEESFVLNTSSKKYHRETCSGVNSMNPQNREDYVGSREELEEQGYEPCGICKP